MKQNHGTLLLLYGLNQGLHYFALGLLLPVLVLVFMDRGFGLDQIGVAMAVMSATVIILELPTGGLADSLGRKRIYMVSLVFNICGYFQLLTAGRFVALISVALFMGVGRALSSGSMDAWFVDEHKRHGGSEEELQKDLATAGVIIPAALGAGTLLGGFIPDLTGAWFAAHTDLGMFGGNISAVLFFYSLQMLLTGLLIRDERTTGSGGLREGLTSFPGILSAAVKYGLTRRNTLAILLATGALGTGLAGLEGLWQPRIREISPETGIWIMGVISASYFLAAAAGNGLSPFLLKLFGRRYRMLLFVFRLLFGILYLTLALALSLGSFIPLYILLFLAHGVTGSPEMTVFNRDIPGEKRSTLLSLNSLFLQGGGAAGSLAAGFLAEHLSIPAAWLLTGGILTASAFFYLMIKDPVKEAVHEDTV